MKKISLDEVDNPKYYQLVSEHNAIMVRWNKLNLGVQRFRVPKVFLFRSKRILRTKFGEPISELVKDWLDWNKRAGAFCFMPNYIFKKDENGELNFIHFTATLRDMINSMETKIVLIEENHNKRYLQIENQSNFIIALIAFTIAIISFITTLPFILTYLKSFSGLVLNFLQDIFKR